MITKQIPGATTQRLAADSVLHLYIPDYQGNIVGVVNTATDSLEQMTDYYPYGLPFAGSTNPTANRNLFCGNFMEPSIGVNQCDFLMRHYLPSMASFVTPDPFCGFVPEVSPYLYCFGDPINYTDPLGLYPDSLSAKYDSMRLYSNSPVVYDYATNKYYILISYGNVKNGEVVVTCRREYGLANFFEDYISPIYGNIMQPIERYSTVITATQVAIDAKSLLSTKNGRG